MGLYFGRLNGYLFLWGVVEQVMNSVKMAVLLVGHLYQ